MTLPLHAVDRSGHRLDELVRAATGLCVREGDLDRVARWVAERVRALAGAEGIEAYAALLTEDSASGRRERELLTVAFSTGETYFMRDQGQMELLATRILPELIERRAAQRSLRLWSAGCASGEEAYSLAMLIDELSPRLDGWNILILGTDINAEAIQTAKKGSYGEWSFRGLDAALRQRYFRDSGGKWDIRKRLRSMASFRQGDLLRERYPDAESELHDMDLILCRNVFIYLEPQAVARITAKLADTLAHGGTLMTGHTELVGHPTGPLRARVFPGAVVFQKTARAEVPTLPAAVLRRELSARLLSASGSTPSGANAAWRADAPATAMRAFEQRVAPKPLPSILPPVRAASAAPTAAAPPAEALEALLAAAWREANRGARAAAEAICREATAIATFDPRPYYLLAQLALERGDAAQALTLLKKVIYLDHSFIAAYMDLGALYDRDGDAVRARQMHQNAQRELKKLPPQATVHLYGESAAAEILAFVERLLGGLTQQAGAAAAQVNGRAHG